MTDEADDDVNIIEGASGLTQDPDISSIIEADREAKERETLAHGYLTPRHRRFAQLAASGVSNNVIATDLGLTPSRVSNLIREPHILAEIHRLQERIFEETIVQRMKAFSEPALNVILNTLTDITGHVKSSEKLDAAKWVIEMQHGKATQKVEAGENMLAVLMDRLDAAKTAPVLHQHVHLYGDKTEQDVTPEVDRPQIAAPKSEEDLLDDWIEDIM